MSHVLKVIHVRIYHNRLETRKALFSLNVLIQRARDVIVRWAPFGEDTLAASRAHGDPSQASTPPVQ